MLKKGEKLNLKPLLERVLIEFPPLARRNADPVQFPRKFFDLGRPAAEIEAVALLSAMLAYGSATQFIKKIAIIMDNCDYSYLKAISGKKNSIVWPAYRLSTAEEIKTFALASAAVINNYGSLKAPFLEGYLPKKSIRDGLISLHQQLFKACVEICGPISRGLKHLMPDPAGGGCVKRWHMFLRWMVRPEDGIDMRLWSEVDPAHLLIPLDRHISRIARNLGLTERRSDDWKTAEEISAALSRFAPGDPIKYDFSLCHLGIAGECTHGKNPDLCRRCLLHDACRAYKS